MKAQEADSLATAHKIARVEDLSIFMERDENEVSIDKIINIQEINSLP